MSEISISFSEQRLLEKCREIEFLCRDLYDYFAELYSGNDEAVRLWRKTAMEEQNHADQFTLALKLSKGLPCMITVDPVKIDSLVLQMQAIIEKVKNDPPTFKDALESAIRLEKYLADFHLVCVINFEDSSYKKLFQAMMDSDSTHIESLQNTLDKNKKE